MQKFFRAQEKSGWCGPAVIQMILTAAGIKKSQKSIAKDIYHSWWGTTHQAILAYLSGFFKSLGYQENAQIKDIAFHLKNKRLVIVNWWDDTDKNEEPEGHYSLALAYNKKQNKITLADPSAGRGVWQIDDDKFKKKWYDYLDMNKKIKVKGWLLRVDLHSKKTGIPAGFSADPRRN